jgi:transcriptional regulator with XRE-family HTH domain
MAEQDLEHPHIPIDAFATGADTVGGRLRQARERLGLSRADVAARTKIAERHLGAIEEDRFADLASSTYAVGFSRAYARAVGLDERDVAQAVRNELDLVEDGDARPQPTFEPGDPARVPSSRTAWLAGLAALAVIVAVLVFWPGHFFPAGSLPDLTSDAPPAPARRVAAAAPAPPAAGPVTVTAREAGVWVKVTDADGNRLFEKQLALGESYTVPADAREPKLRTARPDALSVAVGGRAVPPLSSKPEVIDAPISAAALLARGAAPAPAVAPPAPVAAPVAQPSPHATAAAPAPLPSAAAATPRPKPSAAATPAPRPKPSASSAPASPKPTAAASPAAAAAPPPPVAASPPAAEAPKTSTVSQ